MCSGFFYLWHFDCRHVKQNIDNDQVLQEQKKLPFESDHGGKSLETSAEWLNGRPDPGKEKKKEKKKNSNKRAELISRLIKNMFVLQLVWIWPLCYSYSCCLDGDTASLRQRDKVQCWKVDAGWDRAEPELQDSHFICLTELSSAQNISHEKAKHDEWLSEAEWHGGFIKRSLALIHQASLQHHGQRLLEPSYLSKTKGVKKWRRVLLR